MTYTSREIRPGEQEGIDFCYVSPQEFEKRLKEGFFLEWSKEYEHYYGSPKQVEKELKNGNSRILVIDRSGAKQVLKHVSDAVTVWIEVPSIAILRQRLLQRGVNNISQIEKRIEQAKKELQDEEKDRVYTYHVLNDDFDKAAKDLEEIFVKELNIL